MDHLLSKELISSKNVSKSHVSHSLVLKEYEGIHGNLCYQKITEVFCFFLCRGRNSV
jgi:hypothetical protein